MLGSRLCARRLAVGIAALLTLCTAASPSMAQPPAQPTPILAEPAAPLTASSTPQPTHPVQIGVAAAVHGHVQIASPGAVGMVAQSGKPIYLGDVVTTDAQSRLQIMLLDETVFTIGPNSSIVIDEFVYDPATDDGKLSADILKGTFRFVTGKIAHKEPTNMQVTLPAGTIGVRGTMVAGRVEGKHSLVVLLGPGPENTVGARIGRIEVGNEVGTTMQSVMVTRPGHGTEIAGENMPPTPPMLVPPQVMTELQHDLSAPLMPPSTLGEPPQEGQEGDTSNAPHRGYRPATDSEGRPMMMRPEGEDMSQPPSPEMLQGMLDSGQITPEQFTEMSTDMEAWNSGDESTRAALMEKYDGQHEGEYQPNELGEYGEFRPDQFGNYQQYGEFADMDPSQFDPSQMMNTPMHDPQYATFYDAYGDFNNIIDPEYHTYIDYLNNQTVTAAQTTTSLAIANGFATKAELATVQTGQYHYTATGVFRQTRKNGTIVDIPGSMNVTLNIDFGSRTIGGGASQLAVNTTAGGGNINASTGLGSRSFDSGTGTLALYTYTSGNLTGDFAVNNLNGVIGGEIDARAEFTSAPDQGAGTINDISRQNGLQ